MILLHRHPFEFVIVSYEIQLLNVDIYPRLSGINFIFWRVNRGGILLILLVHDPLDRCLVLEMEVGYLLMLAVAVERRWRQQNQPPTSIFLRMIRVVLVQ